MHITIKLETDSHTGMQYRSAWAASRAGQAICYHSSHPEAESALLIRAIEPLNRVAWLSDSAMPSSDGYIYLCWLGGIAGCQGGPHRFTLSANGEDILELFTCAANTRPQAQYQGKDGICLRYEHQLTDMCDDHFGLFWLRLPDRFASPAGLQMELRAADEASQDWMMVFEYPFAILPRLHLEPILTRMGDQVYQQLAFGMDCLAESCMLRLQGPGGEQESMTCGRGYKRLKLDIPSVERACEITVDSWLNGCLAESKTYTLHPVVPRVIHLLPYSHNDIGYTEIQDRVAELQCANIDKALDLISQSSDHPFDPQAKWNLEVIWALEIWLEKAEPQRREMFLAALRSGNIGLNALFANPLTGLCNPVEMMRHFDLAQKLKAMYGIEIDTATVTDIPGFALTLLPALARNGVRYFSIAPNAGDRTGYIYEGLGDQPFYWQCPSGEVLTWVTGAGYSRFHKEKITGNGIRHLIRYLRELEMNGYPYAIAGLPYTIGGDNGGPDDALADFVKQWNETHHSPRLVISTHRQMFADFAARYGAELPTRTGDMTPYWEDGAMSTASETVLTRRNAFRLTALQSIMALYHPEKYHAEEMYDIWQQIVLWDEHTWGAWNSVSDPDLPFVKRQWEIKRGFALRANQMIDKLGDALHQRETHPGLGNPLSFPAKKLLRWRSDSYANRLPGRADGRDMPLQTAGNDLLCACDFRRGWEYVELLWTADVPPEPQMESGSLPLKVENRWFEIEFASDSGGIRRLYDKDWHADVLDGGADLGELRYVPRRDLEHVCRAQNARLLCHENGALCRRIVISVHLQGCREVEMEYLIYHDIKQISLCLRVDKLAVREKESLHLALPFAIPDAVLRYDSACSPLRVETDQMPGMCRNFISTTSYIDLSAGDRGITIVTPDAPLFEVGGLNAEIPWLRHLDNPGRVWSYLMNNIWHTNYKADQEGPCEFAWHIGFHGAFQPGHAAAFAWQHCLPSVFCDPTAVLPDDFPHFDLPLLVLCVSRVHDAVLIHLVNTADHPQALHLNKPCRLSDPSGADLGDIAPQHVLAAYEQVFLLVK